MLENHPRSQQGNRQSVVPLTRDVVVGVEHLGKSELSGNRGAFFCSGLDYVACLCRGSETGG